MAINLKEKSIGTLVLVTIIGILIGGYLNTLTRALIPGKNNVVKTFFTTNIKFGIGDFGDSEYVVFGIDDYQKDQVSKPLQPLIINLYAIKFQLGFQLKLSFMSIIGLFISLYIFRWYQ